VDRIVKKERIDSALVFLELKVSKKLKRRETKGFVFVRPRQAG
jgi:hypothetical protein